MHVICRSMHRLLKRKLPRSTHHVHETQFAAAVVFSVRVQFGSTTRHFIEAQTLYESQLNTES